MTNKERWLVYFLTVSTVIIFLDQLLMALIAGYTGLFRLYEYLPPQWSLSFALILVVFILLHLFVFLFSFYAVLNGKQRPLLYVVAIWSTITFILVVIHALETIYEL